MSKQSLAVKYRPKRFNEVVEQDVTKAILIEQLKTKTFRNCLLFCGGAGTGKTSDARIFANEVNDFKGHTIEIDAASNNGVDDARKIIEDAKTQSLDSEYKVFILDECHMFSIQAWNALLKLVEEPPKKSILIFCTTDPHKIPDTILSRVQRFNFQKISYQGIVNRLKYIIESENKENSETDNNSDTMIIYEESALEFIAKQADGGMRDAITLLDKAIGYSDNLNLENVLEALGSVNYDTMFELTDAINVMDKKHTIEIIESVYRTGLDLKQFIKQYSNFVLDVCKYDLFRSFDYLQMPQTYESKLSSYNDNDYVFFNQLLGEVIRLNDALKNETVPKPLVESRLLLLCQEA